MAEGFVTDIEVVTFPRDTNALLIQKGFRRRKWTSISSKLPATFVDKVVIAALVPLPSAGALRETLCLIRDMIDE